MDKELDQDFAFTEAMHKFGAEVGKPFNIEICVTARRVSDDVIKLDIFSAVDPVDVLPFLLADLSDILEEEQRKNENFGGTP